MLAEVSIAACHVRVLLTSHVEPSDAAAVVPARIAFSVPIVTAYPSPLSAGPVFASHPLDMQVLDTSNETDSGPSKTHTGAPTCNVEVKLLHISEEAVAGGADPEGEVSTIWNSVTAFSQLCSFAFVAPLSVTQYR